MKRMNKNHIRYLILAAALASCAFGALRGEPGEVLKKAVMLCLECCGIG